MRGEAYLAAHEGKKAAGEFQKIIDHLQHRRERANWRAGTLGLARAYLLSGDTAKAKAAYQVFFPSGKMPIPRFPHGKEAKAEYAKLQ